MEKEKIIRTIIITLICLVLVGIGIYNMWSSEGSLLILGTWESAAEDGTVVSYEFTDELEKSVTLQNIYNLTITYSDGTTVKEKGTYNIANDETLTFRPEGVDASKSTTVAYVIKKDKLICNYEVDFLGEKEITFTKVAEYEKKGKK